MMGLERLVPDPTALLVIDEADRLKIAGLEQARSVFDQGGIGMILIGMPGLEKRLARYPQFYSRIGFVHEFRPLSASEIRQLLERHWTPPGVKLPGAFDSVAAASIIRITGGNFRLLHRLLTQVERILEINALPMLPKRWLRRHARILSSGRPRKLYAAPFLARVGYAALKDSPLCPITCAYRSTAKHRSLSPREAKINGIAPSCETRR